jgi:protein disulfide-isomerase A1
MFAPSPLHVGLQEAFVPLAKHYAEYISFLVIDSTEYANMLPQMGLQGRGFPCAALYNPKMGQVFRFEGGEVVPGGVEEFINGIVSGQNRPLDVTEEGVESNEDSHGHAHDEL